MFYLMTLKKKNEKKMGKKYVIIWCSFKYVQCMEYTFGENHIIFKRGFFFKKKNQHQQLHPLQLCNDIA